VSQYELALQRAVAELRERLVADARALAAGGCSSGGIRRLWRQQARHLAALRSRAGQANTHDGQPHG
jgi:hypothetical protein